MIRLVDAFVGPGLRTLLGMRVRAAVRSSLRRLRTPGGWAVVLFVLLFPALVVGIQISDVRSDFMDYETLDRIGPVLLAASWLSLLVLRGGAEEIGFSSAEADQLFAAPHSAAQLIRYKVAMMVITWGVMGGLLGPIASVYTRHVLGGPLAAWTLLPALQLSAMVLALAVDHRSGPASRLIVGVVLAGLAGLAVGAMPDEAMALVPTIEAVVRHPVGRVLLYPFAAGSTLFTSADPLELVWATAVMLVVNAGLVGVVLTLGRRAWLERAAAGAARRAALVRRYQSGGLSATGGVWMVRVPRLPFLGGVGPVAWRRLVEMVRRPLSLVAFAGPLVIAAIVGGGLTTMGDVDVDVVFGMVLGSVLWSLWMLPVNLRLDFRSDLDRMDQLRALPVPAFAVVLGQILPMAGLLTLAGGAVVAGATVFRPELWVWSVGAAVFLPTAVLFSLAVENLLFLLLPVRIEAGEAALASVGRNLLSVFGAHVINVTSVGVVGALGMVVTTLVGSVVAGFATAAVAMTVGALVVIGLAAWRFRRFDPSRDVPS